MHNSLGSASRLAALIGGAQVARMISVAAELRIADLLENGPRSCADLAVQTETNPEALFRLLRALASLGIFFESGDREFALTDLADPLRTNSEISLRALALLQN